MEETHIAPYRKDIDGLRALAVLLVVAFHASPTSVPGGFIGVDIFFVISGYLITGNILRDLGNNRFSFSEFYARRCRRIVPALAVVLIGTLAIGWYTLLPSEFSGLGTHVLAGSTFTTNILVWKQAGYFDAAAESKPLLHLWSLGVEEQFYLLWPPLLFLIFRARVDRASAVLILAIASFSLNILDISHHAIATFYLLPTRFWELLVGAGLSQYETSDGSALARFTPRLVLKGMGRMRHKAVAASVVSTAAALAIIGAAFRSDIRDAFPGWWALVPTMSAALIVLAGRRAWLNRLVLSSRPAVFVGLISYPLYLWHWPLLSIAGIVEGGAASRGIRGGAVVLAALLAWATWRFIEQPVRRLVTFDISLYNMRQYIGLSALALALIAVAGWSAKLEAGFPSRLRSRSFADQTQAQGLDSVYQACSGVLEPGRRLSWCYTTYAADPEIAVFGDSHAYYLFPGLASEYSKIGSNLLVIGETACAPLSGVRSYLRGSQEQCSSANALALDLIVASPSIRAVVLVSQGPYYFSGVSVAADEVGTSDASNWVLEPIGESSGASKEAFFQQGLSRTISRLESAGKQVVFFLDVPELDFHPQACVDSRIFRLTPTHVKSPCAISKVSVIERQSVYRRMVDELSRSHPQMRVFDPLPYFCHDSLCSAMDGDRLLYRDSHHVSSYGSEYLARRFMPWLQAKAATVLAGQVAADR